MQGYLGGDHYVLAMNLREQAEKPSLTGFRLHGRNHCRRFMEEFSLEEGDTNGLHGKLVNVFSRSNKNHHIEAVSPYRQN